LFEKTGHLESENYFSVSTENEKTSQSDSSEYLKVNKTLNTEDAQKQVLQESQSEDDSSADQNRQMSNETQDATVETQNVTAGTPDVTVGTPDVSKPEIPDLNLNVDYNNFTPKLKKNENGSLLSENGSLSLQLGDDYLKSKDKIALLMQSGQSGDSFQNDSKADPELAEVRQTEEQAKLKDYQSQIEAMLKENPAKNQVDTMPVETPKQGLSLEEMMLQSGDGSLFEKTGPTLQAPAEQQVEQEPAANNQPASEQVQQAQQKAVKAQQEAEALQKAAESMQEYAAVSRDE